MTELNKFVFVGNTYTYGCVHAFICELGDVASAVSDTLLAHLSGIPNVELAVRRRAATIDPKSPNEYLCGATSGANLPEKRFLILEMSAPQDLVSAKRLKDIIASLPKMAEERKVTIFVIFTGPIDNIPSSLMFLSKTVTQLGIGSVTSLLVRDQQSVCGNVVTTPVWDLFSRPVELGSEQIDLVVRNIPSHV